MSDGGFPLLQLVANRILAAHLALGGCNEVAEATGKPAYGRNVDLVCLDASAPLRAKVKPDPYFGRDLMLAADRSRAFYRMDTNAYAFESRGSDNAEGWALESDASQIWYYRLAIVSPEEDVRALVREDDGVLFSELQVERDELVTIPAAALRAWFEPVLETYPPRPVATGEAPAWYRLVPRDELEGAVAGVRVVGPVFTSVRAAVT